jgi:hypothetical protein
MLIDYSSLAALLSSARARGSDNAMREAFRGIARDLGIVDAIDEALASAARLQENADPHAKVWELRLAFRKIEDLGRHHAAYATFSNFVSDVSRLGQMLGDSRRYGTRLLDTCDGPDASIIAPVIVREHIRTVIGLLDGMGEHYFYQPAQFSPLITMAYSDLGTMDYILCMARLDEMGSSAATFRDMVRRINQAAWRARARFGGSVGSELNRLSVEMNEGLSQERYGELLGLMMEIWVRSIDAADPYSDFRTMLKPKSGFFPSRERREPDREPDTNPPPPAFSMHPVSPIASAFTCCTGLARSSSIRIATPYLVGALRCLRPCT